MNLLNVFRSAQKKRDEKRHDQAYHVAFGMAYRLEREFYHSYASVPNLQSIAWENFLKVTIQEEIDDCNEFLSRFGIRGKCYFISMVTWPDRLEFKVSEISLDKTSIQL